MATDTIPKWALVKWIENPPTWSIVKVSSISSDQLLDPDNCTGCRVTVEFSPEQFAPAEIVMLGSRPRLAIELERISNTIEAAATPVPLGRGHREKKRTKFADESFTADEQDADEVKQAKKRFRFQKGNAAASRAREILARVQQHPTSNSAAASPDLEEDHHTESSRARQRILFGEEMAAPPEESPEKSSSPQPSIADENTSDLVSQLQGKLLDAKTELAVARADLKAALQENARLRDQLLAVKDLPFVVDKLTATVEALQRAPRPLAISSPQSPVKPELHAAAEDQQYTLVCATTSSPSIYVRKSQKPTQRSASPVCASHMKAQSTCVSQKLTQRSPSPVCAPQTTHKSPFAATASSKQTFQLPHTPTSRHTAKPCTPSTPKIYTQGLEAPAVPEDDMITIGPHTKISKTQYSFVQWRGDGKKAAKELAVAVFSRHTLATHTLTGKASNARKDVVKPALDQDKLQDIIDHVAQKMGVNKEFIRKAIRDKCHDEAKLLRTKQQ